MRALIFNYAPASFAFPDPYFLSFLKSGSGGLCVHIHLIPFSFGVLLLFAGWLLFWVLVLGFFKFVENAIDQTE